MESYVRSHHLWRPLAAMSGSEQQQHEQQQQHQSSSIATTGLPATYYNSTTASLKTVANYVLSTILSMAITTTATAIPGGTTTTTTTTTTTDESNDVWYPVVFKKNSSLYFERFDDRGDVIYFPGNYSLSSNLSVMFSNVSVWNRTTTPGFANAEETIRLVTMIGTAVLLGFIILATVIGNVFVIAAILLERNLQNVANYLILSLAVADLLVACLVMPLGAVYEVSQEWTLGPELCDMWTSSDVLCCTASILHLVAIALDRYWAVTNIDYIHQRTSKRIGMMIFIIWLVSFLVCIAPLLGWKDPNWNDRIRDRKCLISQDLYYQIFATASSFYLPLLVILILYWRIFQTARKRIRRRQVIGGAATSSGQNPAAGGIAGGLAAASGTGGIAAAVVTIIGRPLPTISETTTAFTTVSSNNSSPEKTSFANGLEADMPTTTDSCVTYQPQHYPVKRKSRDSADSKRERKAAKTLAIITGAFVLCWLPFFIMAVLLPIDANLFEKYVISIFLWLGYFNSTLNPIIYTIFSPEFRHAFKKILCGRNYARRNKHFGIRHFQ